VRGVINHQNKLQLGSFTVLSKSEKNHVINNLTNMERYILVFCVVYLVCIESSGANFFLDCQNQLEVVKFEGRYKMIKFFHTITYLVLETKSRISEKVFLYFCPSL
jgi:hypothetical protein